jgi:hypothetical protein
LPVSGAIGRDADTGDRMTNAELWELARAGAQARLAIIEQETQSLLCHFPALPAGDPAPHPAAKRRQQMSAAGRRAVSLAQKRRWSAWRKKRAAARK